jgi:hypothetical protein
MARFLLILVGVGVLLNALTFLMVAHYFSQEKEPVVQASPRPGPAPEAKLSPELLGKINSLESSIKGLSQKVDTLTVRSMAPAAPASIASPRSSRGPRQPAGRPGPTGPAAAAAGEEEEPAGAEEVAPPAAKKLSSRPAPSARVPVDAEKQNPPADGAAPHPADAAPPGEVPAGTPAPGADGNATPPAGEQPAPDGAGNGNGNGTGQ